MSRRHLLIAGVVVLIVAAAIAVWPPFLLPDQVYATIYGWRYPKVWECGDGQLTDTGPRASHSRYVARLGLLPLDRATDRSYKLCKLPNEPLVLGFNVKLAGGFPLFQDPSPEWLQLKEIEVSVRVIDSRGVVLIDHDGPLVGAWTWSGPYADGAFVYGETRIQAQPADSYDIHVTITPTNELTGVQAHLILRGGGWK